MDGLSEDRRFRKVVGTWIYQRLTNDYCFLFPARNFARSFSVSISPATTAYSSSTEEQRSAARLTTTLAIGPINAANSRLTESSSAGCNLLLLAGSLAGRE